MKITKKNFSNIMLLKIFVLVVGTLVLSSLILKGVGLFVSRSFDKSTFTLLVKNPSSSQIIHLDREFKSIEIFSIPELKIPNGSILQNSLFLMVPLDGVITIKTKGVDGKNLLSLGFLMRAVVDENKFQLTGLNAFDLTQMYFFAKSVRGSDIILTTLEKDTFGGDKTTPEALIESIKNKDIINEGKDIEVDNATDIDGLGAKVAQLLKNEGFNVVITKSKEKSSVSKITFREIGSETSKRLEKIFGVVGVQTEDGSIADITVTIATDIGDKLNN